MMHITDCFPALIKPIMGIKDTKFQGQIKQKLEEGGADPVWLEFHEISMDIDTVLIITEIILKRRFSLRFEISN